MSIERISSSVFSSASLGSEAIGAAQAAQVAARSVAQEVLGQIGALFLPGLFEASQGAGEGADFAGLAETLGDALGATTMEKIDIEQALGTLGTALASDMASLADGRTLERLEAALADVSASDAGATPAGLAADLQFAAAQILAAR